MQLGAAWITKRANGGKPGPPVSTASGPKIVPAANNRPAPVAIGASLDELPEVKAKAKKDKATPAERATARARRLWKRGRVRPVWEKRRQGSHNRDVRGVMSMLVPRYVNAAVRAAMSKSVLLGWLACLDEADLDGQFEMPAGQLGDNIGCNRRNAQKVLTTLTDAGLIRLIHGGGPKTPNVYGLTPWREFDPTKAIEALERARQETTADIRLRKASGG
jgi:hypothetical protein